MNIPAITAAQLCLLSLLASGCTGADGETYLGRPGSPAWFATASSATIADHYEARCIDYGFHPGTPDMARCIQSEVASGRNAAAVRSASASSGLATGAAIMAANNAANQPRRTTCTRAYNIVNCTTY